MTSALTMQIIRHDAASIRTLYSPVAEAIVCSYDAYPSVVESEKKGRPKKMPEYAVPRIYPTTFLGGDETFGAPTILAAFDFIEAISAATVALVDWRPIVAEGGVSALLAQLEVLGVKRNGKEKKDQAPESLSL